MPGLDLVAVQDTILAHIETSFPAYEIKEDEVLDSESLLRLNKNIKPFIVVRWLGLSRSPVNTSFGGVRWDEYSSGLDIVFVAPSPRQARRGLNMVMDELIGWPVPGGGELIPEGGQSVVPVLDQQGVPHLYLAIDGLSFQVDSNALAP